MINRVILIGRLTRKPELRYTSSGLATTQFTLAVDRPTSGDKKRSGLHSGCDLAEDSRSLRELSG